MDVHSRPGHVNKNRLLQEGSVFARQLARAQQAVVQQQPVHRAEASDGVGTPTEQQEEPAVISHLDLWNARTIATQVGVSLSDEATRLREIHLWWPLVSDTAAGNRLHLTRGPKGKASRLGLLQQSSRLSQLLQHPGALNQEQRDQEEAGSQRLLSEGRKLAAALLGPPSGTQQDHLQHINSNTQPTTGQSATINDWVCCNKGYPAGISDPVSSAAVASSVAVCGFVNPCTAVCCCECGAARWDGPSGQLSQRLWAVMQTADLDATGTRQVAARLTAESGSNPAFGLQLQPEAVQQGVMSFLKACREKKAAAAAAAGATRKAGDSAASSLQSLIAAGMRDKPQLTSGDRQHVAEGVFQSLNSWHHQQQALQQSQQQHDNTAKKIHTAAAAAAALAPELLTAVFRRHNGLQQETALKPVRSKYEVCPIHDWMADVLEQTVAAASRRQLPGSPATEPTGIAAGQCRDYSRPTAAATHHPHPVWRPLPASTLQQLLDRKTAVLRQEVIDFANKLAARGGLPVVKRTLQLAVDDSEDGDDKSKRSEGDRAGFLSASDNVLLCEEMPVREWLWSRKYQRGPRQARVCLTQDVVHYSKLPAASSRRSHPGDLDLVVHITCEDWELVQSVRRHLQAVLSAWQQAIGPELTVQLSSSAAQSLLEEQIQSQLIAQLQYFPQAWGTAAPLNLRQTLFSWRAGWQQQEQQQLLERLRCFRRKQPGRRQPRAAEGPGTSTSAATTVQEKQPSLQHTAVMPSMQGIVSRDEQQLLHEPNQKRPSRKRGREQLLKVDDSKADDTPERLQQPRRLTRSAVASASTAGERHAIETNLRTHADHPDEVAADGCGAPSAANSDSSATESSNRQDSDSGKNSTSSSGADSPGSSGINRQEPTSRGNRHAHPQQRRRVQPLLRPTATDAQCELLSDITEHLRSLDDLLSAQSVNYQDILAEPAGVWTAVHAQDSATKDFPGAVAVQSVADLAGGVVVDASGLPYGMQQVLQQASAMGVSYTVLQRVVTRLKGLITLVAGGEQVST